MIIPREQHVNLTALETEAASKTRARVLAVAAASSQAQQQSNAMPHAIVADAHAPLTMKTMLESEATDTISAERLVDKVGQRDATKLHRRCAGQGAKGGDNT